MHLILDLYNDYIFYNTFQYMSEQTGLENTTYDILSALAKDADFLYDTIDKYIDDAKKANKNDEQTYGLELKKID